MGFFDLFKGGSGGGGALKKHAARVANKRAQAPDRWESIQALAQIGTPEAIDALLVRFSYLSDPSITDQEEKDAAYEAVIEAGEVAIEPVKRFMRATDAVSWAVRMLDTLLPPGESTAEIISVLGTMDLEYERDPERKLTLLSMLEERRDPRIVGAVSRFLGDVNESARFHACAAIYTQENAADARAELLAALVAEDSVRSRARILAGFAERGWDVGEHAEKLKKQLPTGFGLDAKGVVKAPPAKK